MIEEVEPHLLKLGPGMERYEALAVPPFDEHLILTMLIESCVKELWEKLKDMSDKRGDGR